MAETKDAIESLLRQRHRLRGEAPDDFRIENPSRCAYGARGAVRTLDLLLIAVASVSLLWAASAS